MTKQGKKTEEERKRVKKKAKKSALQLEFYLGRDQNFGSEIQVNFSAFPNNNSNQTNLKQTTV